MEFADFLVPLVSGALGLGGAIAYLKYRLREPAVKVSLRHEHEYTTFKGQGVGWVCTCGHVGGMNPLGKK